MNSELEIPWKALEMDIMSIAVAARSKAWVYGRQLAGIAGSNPAGRMVVCLL